MAWLLYVGQRSPLRRLKSLKSLSGWHTTIPSPAIYVQQAFTVWFQYLTIDCCIIKRFQMRLAAEFIAGELELLRKELPVKCGSRSIHQKACGVALNCHLSLAAVEKESHRPTDKEPINCLWSSQSSVDCLTGKERPWRSTFAPFNFIAQLLHGCI